MLDTIEFEDIEIWCELAYRTGQDCTLRQKQNMDVLQIASLTDAVAAPDYLNQVQLHHL